MSLSSHPASFILLGIPGLESVQFWIAFPFCAMYAVAVVGNITLLHVIRIDHTLHKPMYLFLAMLPIADLVLSSSSQPKMLAIFWFHAHEIKYHACLIQMFLLHGFTIMQSGVPVAMAFDRYVAICDPLRYTTILTNSRIIQMDFLMITCAVVLIVPLLLLLKPLCFYRMNALSHAYCYHPDVIQLTYSDIQTLICGLIDLILTTGIDTPCIALSYILIIHSVLRIASPEEWHKVFSTCVSHVGAVAIFYLPMLGLSLVYRYGRSAPRVVRSVMANVYLLLPPVFSPIIYSVKPKQIHKALLVAFGPAKDM
uniref:G-protein coupled receptors family 1 profile domain-containing protein n=1 Tax=Piliocolobus tephrosceles TaxID=591936 RepID=A0A8C9H4G5_9PRIM